MLATAIEAAVEAGRFLRYSVGKVLQIEHKGGLSTNLVTQIDKESEAIIIGRIKERYPDHALLAEESGSNRVTSDYCWVIDPLDGTTNFAHGYPIFSVSIGLQYRGDVIAGVVYDPSAEELFTAEKGNGAYLNGKRLRVSEAEKLADSLLVTGFPYNVRDNPDHVVEHFVNFLKAAQGIRRLGSAALDLCYIASGRLDGFWEVYLNPWDKAAGILMVEEAGGRVTDFRGGKPTFERPNTLATNGRIHNQMLDIISREL